MSGTRHFDGGRDKGRIGFASEIMRLEIQKQGKLPAADRYKSILKKRFLENKQKAVGPRPKLFQLPGSLKEARVISKTAEIALKQIAQRKAAKEAKALRQMVIVQPRLYPNGNLSKHGKIYDVAGNIVGQVNTKNGKISTTLGWSLGKYKPKSYFTHINIQKGIDQFSPYFINLRKQQLMQQQGVAQFNAHGPQGDVINVYGNNTASDTPAAPSSFYGSDGGGPRQNIGMTSWGARSDNVWGTYTDNVWGGSMDNVWGGNSTDVWGGIGVGGLWGQKGPNVWGTGNGKNYLRGVTNAIAALFGLSNKKNRDTLKALNSAARNSSSRGSTRTAPSAPAPRTGR